MFDKREKIINILMHGYMRENLRKNDMNKMNDVLQIIIFFIGYDVSCKKMDSLEYNEYWNKYYPLKTIKDFK